MSISKPLISPGYSVSVDHPASGIQMRRSMVAAYSVAAATEKAGKEESTRGSAGRAWHSTGNAPAQLRSIIPPDDASAMVAQFSPLPPLGSTGFQGSDPATGIVPSAQTHSPFACSQLPSKIVPIGWLYCSSYRAVDRALSLHTLYVGWPHCSPSRSRSLAPIQTVELVPAGLA
jgi:hypothetical protein